MSIVLPFYLIFESRNGSFSSCVMKGIGLSMELFLLNVGCFE